VEAADPADARRGSDDLESGPDRVRVRLREPGDQAVGLAHFDHERSEDVAVGPLAPRVFLRHAAPAAQDFEPVRVLLEPREFRDLDELDLAGGNAELPDSRADL